MLGTLHTNRTRLRDDNGIVARIWSGFARNHSIRAIFRVLHEGDARRKSLRNRPRGSLVSITRLPIHRVSLNDNVEGVPLCDNEITREEYGGRTRDRTVRKFHEIAYLAREPSLVRTLKLTRVLRTHRTEKRKIYLFESCYSAHNRWREIQEETVSPLRCTRSIIFFIFSHFCKCTTTFDGRVRERCLAKSGYTYAGINGVFRGTTILV